MSNVETLNEYIEKIFQYWNGETTEEFELIPIPEEVDREMQKDSFY